VIILAAEIIRRYEGPQWLVTLTGKACDAEDLGELSKFGSHVTILETGVIGWGDYNAIIRYREHRDDRGTDYLAKTAP